MRKIFSNLSMSVVILSISATLPLQADTSAGHYRWKDTQGNVHYSDRPPEGVESEYIKFSTRKRTTASTEATPEAMEKKSGSGERKMEILPEKSPKLCKQAQANLTALDGARIRITEPDGSQRFLTEEEKEQQRENARKFIKLHCD